MASLAVAYMASRILNIIPNTEWWFILPMVVWVVYSLDHIIDSTKRKERAIIERHRFHYINSKPIIIAVVIIGVVAIWLSFTYLDYLIIRYGIILSFIIGVYFSILVFLKDRKLAILQKELFIAIVYTSGLFMAPLVWYGSLPSFSVIIIIFCICTLAWAEGIMISYFDFENDIKDGHSSLSIILGKKITRRFILVLHIAIEALLVIVLLLIEQSDVIVMAMAILIVMNLILGLIILFPYSTLSNRYHRVIGESVFFLPALIVLA